MTPVALEDITATAVTRRLIALTEEGGLRPAARAPGRYGRVAVILSGKGRDALFGVIYVSARKGTALRAFLTHGNWGEEKRYETVAEVRTVLKSWAALQRPREPSGGKP
jgi:hypothetical protein